MSDLVCHVKKVATESPIPEDAVAKPHHPQKGKKTFRNPWPSWQEVPQDALKAHVLERDWLSTWSHSSISKSKFEVKRPVFSTERLSSGDDSAIHATWLGHACYLVEYPSGLRVLFDPVFTDRCSPSSWVGPKRFTPPPCQIGEIPFIDVVVISHNHYDHLSHPTVKQIQHHHPNAHFFVPLGNAAWFRSSGVPNVTELDWWEQAAVTLEPADEEQEQQEQPPISALVSCLPAQHTTGRDPFNTDKTLWASWGVKSGPASVFFGGDTGYRFVPWLKDQQDRDWDKEHSDLPVCPAFAQVGELHGPFTLGLLPIGAYEPRALMSSIHANPRDAVEIFKDTRCRRALAMHWGTWVLGDEDVQEPPRRLAEAMETVGLPGEGVFDACLLGERVRVAVE